MAGLYTDVPGTRFAYDTDGTLVKVLAPDDAYVTPLNVAGGNTETALDEMGVAGAVHASGTGVNINSFTNTTSIIYLVFAFPQVRSLTGYYALTRGNGFTSHTPFKRHVQWSADTTDGSDGTWTVITDPWVGLYFNNTANASISVRPFYRSAITPLSLTGVKGIRFGFAWDVATGPNNNDFFSFSALHLYGTITGATGGLRFWHPTLDQEIGGAAFDFGDIPQGTQVIKQFRVKNTHTLTANTTTIAAAANGTSDAGLASGLMFSADNATYASTATVATLAAGAISPVLYVRRTVGAAETPLLRSARVTATAGSFS